MKEIQNNLPGVVLSQRRYWGSSNTFCSKKIFVRHFTETS